jgi:hypothetical protein
MHYPQVVVFGVYHFQRPPGVEAPPAVVDVIAGWIIDERIVIFNIELGVYEGLI